MIQNMVLGGGGGGGSGDGSTDWKIASANSYSGNALFFNLEQDPEEYIVFYKDTQISYGGLLEFVVYTNNYRIVCGARSNGLTVEFKMLDATTEVNKSSTPLGDRTYDVTFTFNQYVAGVPYAPVNANYYIIYR